jgi:hypothetical protein
LNEARGKNIFGRVFAIDKMFITCRFRAFGRKNSPRNTFFILSKCKSCQGAKTAIEFRPYDNIPAYDGPGYWNFLPILPYRPGTVTAFVKDALESRIISSGGAG